MANSIKVAIWLVLGVLHLPTLVLPWLYWQKRQYDPLRSRRPALFTQCLTVCVAFLWHQILRNGIGHYLGLWWNMIVSGIILLVAYESFFVFALSQYIAYNKTKEQMAIYQALSSSSTSTPADVDTFMRSIKWSSFLLSNRFAFGWVWANTAVWMGVLIGYAQPMDYYSIPLDDVASGLSPSPYVYFTPLLLGRNLVTIGCLVVTSFRLRIVQDAFGTKAMLKRIGLFTTCTTTFYLVASNKLMQASPLGIQDFINLIGADYVIAIAFVIPWLTAMKSTRMISVAERSAFSQANTTLSDFELFLLTENGFAAFEAYLEKEFSVENLLFWKEVMGFRGDPTSDHAWSIFDKFLSTTAPLEVNLPSSTLLKFRDVIFKTRDGFRVEDDMFDDAADQLVRLMEVNSLQRFLKTNPPSWANFMELREEQKALEHAVELRKTKTSTMKNGDFDIKMGR